jgi:hypothetical protein
MRRFCLGFALLPALLFLALIAGFFIFSFFTISQGDVQPVPPPNVEREGPVGPATIQLPPDVLTATAVIEDQTGADIIEQATAAAEPDTSDNTPADAGPAPTATPVQ